MTRDNAEAGNQCMRHEHLRSNACSVFCIRHLSTDMEGTDLQLTQIPAHGLRQNGPSARPGVPQLWPGRTQRQGASVCAGSRCRRTTRRRHWLEWIQRPRSKGSPEGCRSSPTSLHPPQTTWLGMTTCFLEVPDAPSPALQLQHMHSNQFWVGFGHGAR